MDGIAWLILPTFNEAENIEAIVLAAADALARAPCEGFRVLVVDDGSPDGTGRIADRLAAEHPGVQVLHRTAKEGIGPAYLAGFRYALDHDAAFVLEMDSDFSHDPADLGAPVASDHGRCRPRAWLPLRPRRQRHQLGFTAPLD